MGVVTFRDRNFIGLAGEFRVMSELLLRGFNPSKSYLDDGYDLILESGLRVEVKCSHRVEKGKKYYSVKHHKNGKMYKNSTRPSGYNFGFRSYKKSEKKSVVRKGFDYAICWCIDDNVFYIIPVEKISGGGATIVDVSDNSKHQYTKNRNNWEQLRR